MNQMPLAQIAEKEPKLSSSGFSSGALLLRHGVPEQQNSGIFAWFPGSLLEAGLAPSCCLSERRPQRLRDLWSKDRVSSKANRT